MKRRRVLTLLGSAAVGSTAGCLKGDAPLEELVKDDLTDGGEDLEKYQWSPEEVELDSIEARKENKEAHLNADVSLSYTEKDGDHIPKAWISELLEYDALHLWDALLDNADAEQYTLTLHGESGGEAIYSKTDKEVEDLYGYNFRIQQKWGDVNQAPDISRFISDFRDNLEVEYASK
ncbi:MAG: hypothetical protein ABEJ72_10910 [Candidatus Aenigmatarchaeota archaeon]